MINNIENISNNQEKYDKIYIWADETGAAPK